MPLPRSALYLLLLIAASSAQSQHGPHDYAWFDQEGPIRLQRRGHPAYRHHIRTVAAATGSSSGSGEPGGGVLNDAAGAPTKGPLDGEEEEPSCDELRTIWRLTKRAAMKSLLSNEIPAYTTGAFGHILHAPQPQDSDQGRYVHGKKVFRPDQSRKKMAGGGGLSARTAGSYERVEEELRRGLFAEKPYGLVNGRVNGQGLHRLGKSDVVYGVYSERGGVTEGGKGPRPLQVVRQKSGREKQRADKMAKTLMARKNNQGPSSSAPPYGKNVGGFSPYANNAQHSCESWLTGRRCEWSVDCACYSAPSSGGSKVNKVLFKCIRGKCTNAYSSSNSNNNARDSSMASKWQQYTSSPTSGVSYYRVPAADKEGWSSRAFVDPYSYRGQP